MKKMVKKKMVIKILIKIYKKKLNYLEKNQEIKL